MNKLHLVLGGALLLVSQPFAALAEIDGHGPDAWKVQGVASNDMLNARMGPGTSYPVIETFAHDERELEQITCIPYYTMKHYSVMSEAEIDALPSPWCLMRSADMSKAGWVAQRYLIADFDDDVLSGETGINNGSEAVIDTMKMLPAPTAGSDSWSSDRLIEHARGLVAALYKYDDPAQGRSYLDPKASDSFFSRDFVAALQSSPPGADLLIGAQDFEGSISEPVPDPDDPMLRGMITINVDFVNFGQAQRAVFRLRGDTSRPDAPLRIFRVEHDGWSFP